MRSFAELLVEYTARSGLSDTELARALGVRRETIFRWKEGLVERPRRREDVLACATKLRLTPDERDSLLLAAGFPPQTQPIRTTMAQVPDTSAIAYTPSETSAPVVAVTGAPSAAADAIPRSRSTRFFVVLTAAVILVIFSGAYFVREYDRPDYPRARSGDMLVIIGKADDPGAERPHGSAVSTDPLAAAIRRETQAVRLDNVRIERWPEKIERPDMGQSVLRNTGAALVLGNARSGDRVKPFVASSIDDRTSEPVLGVLLTELRSECDAIDVDAPNGDRRLALLATGYLYAERGDLDLSRAFLVQARSLID